MGVCGIYIIDEMMYIIDEIMHIIGEITVVGYR